MKSAFLYSLILLSFLYYGRLSAGYEKLVETEVGKQPVGVFYDETGPRLHIFCAGHDADFSGTFDEGEEKPSWWTINPASGVGFYLAAKVKEFDVPFVFPFRPAFIPSSEGDAGKIFIPFMDRIRSYDISDFSVLDDEVTSEFYNSAFPYGPHLLLTRVGMDSEMGSVSVFNPEISNILQTMETGRNTQECIAFQASDQTLRLAVLNGGPFGEKDGSTIQTGKIVHTQNPVLKEMAIGDVANHLSWYGDMVAVTLNGSSGGAHEVKIVDILSEEVTHTFEVGTSGFNGPRETKFINSGTQLAVTTYAGDFRIIDIASGEIETVETPGKAESLVMVGNYIGVVTPFNADYSPQNKISFYEVTTGVEAEEAEIAVYPNPASELLNIIIPSGSYDLSITDAFGRRVYARDNVSGANLISIGSLGLASGAYAVQLRSGGRIVERMVNFIR